MDSGCQVIYVYQTYVMLSESSAFLLKYNLVAGYAGKWKSKSSNINQ